MVEEGEIVKIEKKGGELGDNIREWLKKSWEWKVEVSDKKGEKIIVIPLILALVIGLIPPYTGVVVAVLVLILTVVADYKVKLNRGE